jgi:LCP family protein required for cell wall assembly
MQSTQEARPRARSAFAAAFLSLLFPGLGHAYAGAWYRALGFAAAPILFLALVAGIVIRLDRTELIGFVFVPWVLPSIFVLNLIALVYRLVAIVDAYRVTRYLNAMGVSGAGRLGRPRIPLSPLSVAGLLAVILVMSGAHVAVARYDLLLSRAADCIFNPTLDCDDPVPSPGGTGPGETGEPGEPTINPSPVGTDVPDVAPPPWDGTERLNILLIGADQQGGGHNTDTLIVLSIDPVSRQVAMFGLPRDTVDVPIPPGPARSVFGPVYRGKINSFYVNVRKRADLFPGTERTRGYNGLKAVLGELYGLDIKYFVEVNFDGFRKVVDALGGVNINVQIPVVDDRFPSDGGRLRRVFIPAGVQHMSGEEALVYARSRNTSSDYDRGQRQQRVLLSLRENADIATILPRVDALAAAVGSAVRTDIPRELVPRLLGLANDVDTRQIRSYVFAPPRYGTEATRNGFVILPDVQRIRATVKAAFAVDPEFEARRERLAEEAATVWVLNGSGQAGQASRVAGYLDHQGIAASAPNQRPEGRNPPATRITVYNGAEERLPETIALLESTFGVTVQTAVDSAVRVDVIIVTSTSTPDLAPPAGP